MLTKCNNYLKGKGRLGKSSGQVSIVLIFVLAIALIFYAVVVNYGRVSQVKTLTTIGANSGAAVLASQMASYGQQVWKTTPLGKNNDKKKCDNSSAAAVVVNFLVKAVAYSLGVGFIKGGVSETAQKIIGIALIGGAAAYDAYRIQPMLTDAWNEATSGSLGPKHAFVEQGLRTGLQAAVTDPVGVPDVHDFDQNQIWGFDANGIPKDEIGRFAFYYTHLLQKIIEEDDTAIVDFQSSLEEFVYDGLDGWGLYDPIGSANSCIYDNANPAVVPSECNPCCVPANAVDVTGEPLRPACCDATTDSCGVSTTCQSASPYGAVQSGSNKSYQFVYNPFLENFTNNSGTGAFVSFLESLGKDDEHPLYFKVSTAPNGVQTPHANASTTSGYQFNDVTGLYSADPKLGVFPFLYKMRDWGVDLTNLNTTNNNTHCYWFDKAYESTSSPCQSATLPTELASVGPLILTHDPATLLFNITNRVDGVKPSGITAPIIVDKVGLPTDPFVAQVSDCAEEAFASGATNKGFWKPGADQFCSTGETSAVTDTDWPYSEGCANKSLRCQASAANLRQFFHEDVLDRIIYTLPAFIAWAETIIAADSGDLVNTMENWYDGVTIAGEAIQGASYWLEPNSAPTTPRSDCYNCDQQTQGLHAMHQDIKDVKNRLESYRDESFAGSSCSDAWCVPPTVSGGECPYVSSTEAATFDVNNNSIRGDLEDVIACLDHNIDGISGNSDEGNDYRFWECRNKCDAASCGNLPRSLLPPANAAGTTGFDPTAYGSPATGDQADITKFLACLDSCSAANCQAMPANQTSNGNSYGFTNNPSTFSASNCGGSNPDAAWTAEIHAAMTQANPSCDLSGNNAVGSIDSNGWLKNVEISAREADNQIDKFKVRRAFLNQRLVELNQFIQILDDADTKFDTFLNGSASPAQLLIDERINAEELDDAPLGNGKKFPGTVVYGWQDEPKPGEQRGKWHIVRADARIPKKCYGSCNINQTPGAGDPGWPRVITWTEDNNSKRCYELINTEGVVKMRVTRFDENAPANSLTFPNGVPIWDLKSFHPERGRAAQNDLDLLESACANASINDPSLPLTVSPGIYDGAFIMAWMVDEATAGANANCWEVATRILANGVSSETCAKYFFNGNSRATGMDFSFMSKCNNF